MTLIYVTIAIALLGFLIYIIREGLRESNNFSDINSYLSFIGAVV